MAAVQRGSSVESDQFYDAVMSTRIHMEAAAEEDEVGGIVIEVPSSSEQTGSSNITEVSVYRVIVHKSRKILILPCKWKRNYIFIRNRFGIIFPSKM